MSGINYSMGDLAPDLCESPMKVQSQVEYKKRIKSSFKQY
jgi:hypothetical protein